MAFFSSHFHSMIIYVQQHHILTLDRPFRILFTEPIVLAISIYMVDASSPNMI